MTPRATESDILAWVEGDALAADRAAAVETSLRADAGLRAWAEGMRRDREALARWGRAAEASAPGGLAEAAMAEAERDAVLGEAPVALARRRDERREEMSRPVVAGRLRWVAMAAGVALAGGVTMVVLLQTGAPAPGVGARGPSADASTRATEEVPPGAGAAVTPGDFEQALADVAGEPAPSGAIALAAPEESSQAHPVRRERRAAPAEMAELARQRRLIVRATARDPHAVLARAVELSTSTDESIAFALDGAGPTGADGVPRGTASVSAKENALTRLVGLLEEAGASGVELVAAEEGGAPAPASAADVLWWTEPVDRWAMLVRVPIVITGEKPVETVTP